MYARTQVSLDFRFWLNIFTIYVYLYTLQYLILGFGWQNLRNKGHFIKQHHSHESISLGVLESRNSSLLALWYAGRQSQAVNDPNEKLNHVNHSGKFGFDLQKGALGKRGRRGHHGTTDFHEHWGKKTCSSHISIPKTTD